MKCLKKILTRPQTCLGFCALVLSVFLSLGLSSDSHATSGNCTLSGSLSTSSINLPLNSLVCDSGFDSTSSYIRVSSFSVTFNSNSSFSGCFSNGCSSFTYSLQFNNNTFPYMFFYTDDTFLSFSDTFPLTRSYTVSDSAWFPTFYSDFSSGSTSYYTNLNAGGTFRFVPRTAKSSDGSFIITFDFTTDSPFSGPSDCPEPEEPEPCPPIPENPYDQKLDDIKRAILTVGAILIMIYFFICLYKIIVKDGGSRK